MPKAAKRKWYAVRKGFEGPRIYETWEETKMNVSRYRGAEFKSFLTRAQAEEWLGVPGLHVGSLAPVPMDIDTPVAKSTGPQTAPRHVVNGDKDESTSDSSSTSSESSVIPATATLRQSAAGPSTSTPAALAVPLAPAAIKLSKEQEHVLSLVKEGKSVFFTGAAGTGKSVLLREIISWCRASGTTYAVTASTGIAAVNIGGCTLHSWAGIGLGKEPAEKLAGKILGQNKSHKLKARQGDESGNLDSRIVQRWRKCRILIIDEISMIDGKLFDKLEYIGRAIRKDARPFGGLQLVLSGDFCQLPPVPDSNSGIPVPATFAFDAEAWAKCIGEPVCLVKVFRQKEQRFVDMLNAMRFGKLDADIVQAFRKLSRVVTYDDGLEPTELFPTRNEVDSANTNRLRSLESEMFTFKAMDTPGWDVQGNQIKPETMNRLLDRLVAPKSIPLKVGAQVMLIKNLIQGLLVNGSLGRVIGFYTTLEAAQKGIMLGVPEGSEKGREWQGWLEALRKGITILNEARAKIPQVLMRDPNARWPAVEFSTSIGPQSMLCVPNAFEVMNADGEVEAKRDQVPLILAWALSIHKSQGQTLERVKVNLTRTFEKGQAYVALSRATSMETLQVEGFDPMKVVAHPRVIEWMRQHTNLPLPPRVEQDVHEEEDAYWDDT